MLKKRLVGVITVKEGLAVQSFGYRCYLPLGNPAILVENLDRWGVDEIVLQCIDGADRPDYSLLERISAKGIGTPIIFAGGIRSVADGVRVIQSGADRICLDSLLHDAPEMVEALSARLGAQALIASLPLAVEDGQLLWHDYRTGQSTVVSNSVQGLLRDKTVSEAMIIDWKNEGSAGGFDFELLQRFPLADVPLIAFGGLTDGVLLRRALEMPQVVAAAVGNSLSYRELAVHRLKEQLFGIPLRPVAE